MSRQRELSPPPLSQRKALRTVCDFELIVPAFNEETRLPETLRAIGTELARLERLSCRIVVVDNGSWDRTSDIVDRFIQERICDADVIGCSAGGKGAAVQRGVLTSQARYVGFFDADLAVPANVIPAAVGLLEEGWPVVVASRRCAGGSYKLKQPLVRRFCGWIFRQSIKGLVPGVADTQCGFKVFTGEAAQHLFRDLSTTGFAFDAEILTRAHAHELPIRELPVAWSDQLASTLRPLSHGPEIFREVLHLRRTAPKIISEAGLAKELRALK